MELGTEELRGAWGESAGKQMGMDGMREGLDQNRPLDPWGAADFSNVYRYDRFFPLVLPGTGSP